MLTSNFSETTDEVTNMTTELARERNIQSHHRTCSRGGWGAPRRV